MPLDVRLFREEATLEKVLESEKKRYPGDALAEKQKEAVDRVNKIAELDLAWRKAQSDVDITKKEKNLASKAVGVKKKAKEDATAEQELAKSLNVKIAELEKTTLEIKQEIERLLPMVGNIVHSSVVVSADEEKDNEIVRTWGEAKSKEGVIPHHEALAKIGGFDSERGVKVAGHRGYFLTGPGVLLNQALVAYALNFLGQREYTPLQPPYFMNKDVMGAVAQLSDFDESLYHVGGGADDEKEGKYLIATSEQPISAFHLGEWFRTGAELPKKYAGYSACFRKEAGKHGKDTWGIFRVHQFDKVEQFVVSEPEKSWEQHEEMVNIAEEFLKSLGLPYRVVNIVSGELNLAASKKYDVEAWFPSYGEFKELVSCSNCLDYQSRAVDVRFGDKEDKAYVHMLNSTLCALTRTICCIMENYQEEEGVRVPEVLQQYMGGKVMLPWEEEKKNN
eukprot:CAMPEP_0184509580 /NCGR_PEP_ID=MMETSP0198_2-20121128/1361_1 /TAXON_ID=1112570 /ORGANISM="Thraustochytrium sp., Strain LLF1b" /LENGTH=448 /DNA_ID=CAMNT_0026899423 /DNA_START=98 /DNA_END=1444 /DNA_ORIENTATION=-